MLHLRITAGLLQGINNNKNTFSDLCLPAVLYKDEKTKAMGLEKSDTMSRSDSE